jgi:hypothetical protein
VGDDRQPAPSRALLEGPARAPARSYLRNIGYTERQLADGIVMGTAGMRASLISREVIADSIELMARAHHFDALVCLTGCDKTTPAAAMALARDGTALTVTGRSLGQECANLTEQPGQRVVASADRPFAAEGALAVLYGNLAPEGSVTKTGLHGPRTHRGPGREPYQRSGALAHYALLVSSASRGAALAGLDDADDYQAGA